jgi:chromosome partitioning protein
MQTSQAEAGRVFPPGYLPPLRYVVSNQKGGQGKTTTTAGLAGVFAAAGRTVRMLDCDPQLASLTHWFPPQWDGVPESERFDIYHVLSEGVPLDRATWPTGIPNLSIVPSFRTAIQFERMPPPGAEFVLREALDEATSHDVTLADCPPNLGQITVAAIASGDDVIIPVLPGALDLAGVTDLNQTIRLVRKRLNPQINVAAVLLRRIRRTAFADAIAKQLLADYPDAIFQIIRHSVRAEEAPLAHQTLTDYAPESTTTADYYHLAARLDEAAARKEGALR